MNTREGEKSRTDSAGQTPSAWDHDPPGAEKLVPFGILMLATGALSLIFGSAETSDFWVDALQHWWTACSRPPVAHQTAGDLPRQRPEELGIADSVFDRAARYSDSICGKSGR